MTHVSGARGAGARHGDVTARAGAEGGGDPRVAAAQALRALGHALVGRDAPPALLAELAAVAADWHARLGTYPARRRAEDDLAADMARPRPPDGQPIEHFADCPVSGAANPFSLGLRARRDGDEAVVTLTLGPAAEGAPGRAHGGVVAAAFDDALGFLTQLVGGPNYGGELTIRYLAPTPLGEPLQIRARVTGSEGRRLFTEATLTHRGEPVATARCTHVTVGPDRLGRPAYDD